MDTLGEPPRTEGSASWWRHVIGEYERLRDLERTDFQHDLRRLIVDLKRDASVLYRAALRLEVRAGLGELKLTDYSVSAIRRRLAASKFDKRLLRFTDDYLGKLEDRLVPQVKPLRWQAWWLDAAAELPGVWIEIYERRRDELRQRPLGRAPSVGLDYLIGTTLEFKTTEIAARLVDAKVLPERENDENDLLAQWKGHLKTARQRYRRRHER